MRVTLSEVAKKAGVSVATAAKVISGNKGNIRVSEKPGLKAETATYEFFIRDNGIGMSKEFQEHIFDSPDAQAR